jgi:hypothetical protein
MSEFITLQQASILTGKSLITLRRFVNGLLDANEPDLHNVLKGGKLSKSQNEPYRIDKNFLLAKMTNRVNTHDYSPAYAETQPNEAASTQTNTQNPQMSRHRSNQEEAGTNHVSTHLIQAKNETIAILREQLKEKDEQIKAMLERDRERNILFRNFQGALQIEAPKTPSVDGDEQSPTTHEQAMSNQEPAPDWLKAEKAREVQTPATGKKHPAKRTTRAKNGTPKAFQKGKDNEQPKKGIFGRLFGK